MNRVDLHNGVVGSPVFILVYGVTAYAAFCFGYFNGFVGVFTEDTADLPDCVEFL